MLKMSKKITLLAIYVGGMFLLPIIILPIIMLIRGYTFEHIQGDGFYSMVGVANFAVYAILLIVLLLLTHKIFKEDFFKISSWGNFWGQVGIGLACTFGAAILGNSIVMLLGTTDTAANQEAIESALAATPFLMIITVIFLGPIVEEIIFRLVLMNLFNWKPVFNIIISSFVFGLIHVLVGGWIHIIPYFLMGLVFGYFYLKNNNIWHVTILHILHNSLTVLLMFWAQFMMEFYGG